MSKKLVRDLLLPFYESLFHFFQTVFDLEDQYDYVVFIARRCSNLAELFYRLILKDTEDSFPSNFITDSALLSLSEHLAAEYRQTGRFPTVLIVDDIVIYGGSLSAFLEELEGRLCDLLEGFDRDSVIAAWLRAVNIRAFARNNQPLLLTSRYQPNFTVAQTLEPKQWRDLSNRVSRLIQIAGWVNSSFISGARVTLAENALDNLWVNGFSRVDTNYDFFPQIIFYREVVVFSNVYAIYTVRLFPSAVDGSMVAVPFVFLPDLPEEGLEQIIQSALVQLRPQLDDTPLDPGGCWQNCPRTRLEALTLLLSSSLLNEFCQMAGLHPIYNGQIKLGMNYGAKLNGAAARFVRNMLSTSNLLSLKQMDNLFRACVMLEGCRPITWARGIEAWRSQGTSDTKKSIEDRVYQIGLKNYQQYYMRTQMYPDKKEETESTPDHYTTVNSLLRQFADEFQSQPFSHLIGWIFQLLDAGILAVAVRAVPRNGVSCISQCVKTGEQSQFILPKRYKEFVPLLIFIQKKSYILNRDFYDELDRFAAANKSFRAEKDKIISFIKNLKESGQDLEDWDFSLVTYPSINSKDWMKELESSVQTLQHQYEYIRDYSNLIQCE